MINSVSLTGRLARPLEVRYTQSGVAVGSFTVAVDRQFTDANGNREADFINCVIWRKGAENLSKFTRKGSMIGVMGHLQVRNYEKNQGQRVYATEVVVDNFALLESKAVTESRPVAGQQAPQPSNFGNAQPNYTNSAVGASPFPNDGKPIGVSDDDVPF